MLIAAFAEILSLGSIIPFLEAMMRPAEIGSGKLPSGLNIGFTGLQDASIESATIIFILFTSLVGILRIFIMWAGFRLAYGAGSEIGNRIYKRTLYQSYITHLNRNSSEVITGIAKQSDIAINMITSALTLTSSVFVLTVILATLLWVNFVLTIILILGLGVVYGAIIFFTRKRLLANGQVIALESRRVIKLLQEGLGGIRDILLNGDQKIYCDYYTHADKSLRSAEVQNVFISAAPKYFVEMCGVALLAISAYLLGVRSSNPATAIPILGVFAFGAQRLLPILQQLYAAYSGLRGGQASLENVISLLRQPMPQDLSVDETPLIFTQNILLENLSYRYDESMPFILEGLSLEFKKGQKVGLVGSTGQGKSTLLDLLMGLLLPTSGRIMVDGRNLESKNIRNWQKLISHVPQSIFLGDTTIEQNIAFGVPISEIDHHRVQVAARVAMLDTFIEGLKDAYHTVIGERGVRLSGGQRQRLGIARALYKKSQILVMDEATSALDYKTENEVMNEIFKHNQEVTLFMVAHRLSTLQSCDLIIEIGNGGVVKIQTSNEFFNRS
jgi:ABC-type multidrug transport system fused ATPase/permease subunit